MHNFAYILPIGSAVGALLYFGHWQENLWLSYLACALVSSLILYFIIRRASRHKEYLSGYALCAEHHEPWVERVVYTETYTDSRGKSHTRRKVRYVHHPDRWLIALNTGRVTDISHASYCDLVAMWGTEEQWINPPHINCVSGGGGQRYDWNEAVADACTETYYGLYINYIRNSNSIFKHRTISDEEAASLGLVSYPQLDSRFLECDAVLTSPMLSDRYRPSGQQQRAIQLFNAFYGQRREIHAFVLLFDATRQGLQTAIDQRAYWHGGNKNEFSVCLGVDTSKEQTEVVWCKAFSWCDIPSLESAAESWFIANRKLDIEAFAEWLLDNVGLWKRKNFSDFKYLGVRLSSGRLAAVYVVAVVLAILIFLLGLYIHKNLAQ